MIWCNPANKIVPEAEESVEGPSLSDQEVAKLYWIMMGAAFDPLTSEDEDA